MSIGKNQQAMPPFMTKLNGTKKFKALEIIDNLTAEFKIILSKNHN
jgi:hypothetical protein